MVKIKKGGPKSAAAAAVKAETDLDVNMGRFRKIVPR